MEGNFFFHFLYQKSIGTANAFSFILLFPVFPGQDLTKKPGNFPDFIFYTTPCASIASATFTKPAILAPFT